MRRIVSACLKLALAAGFAISMGLSAATPAGAFTGDQWKHIVDCAGWMFSDPARHAAECGPGHLGDITSDSRGWGFGGSPLAPPKENACDDNGPSHQPASYDLGTVDPSILLVEADDCNEGCRTAFDTGTEQNGLILKVVECDLGSFEFEGPEFSTLAI